MIGYRLEQYFFIKKERPGLDFFQVGTPVFDLL